MDTESNNKWYITHLYSPYSKLSFKYIKCLKKIKKEVERREEKLA